LKETVEKLEFAEDKLKDAIAPFLTNLFHKFYSRRDTWLKVLSILTELDCLASFAILSG
jgi:DNA mismatch repair ATPase MutS